MEEQGYCRINNSLFDWLLTQGSTLTKREYAVLWCVIRYTVGFRRSTALLSARYICSAIGHDPRSYSGVIHAALRSLQEKGLVSVTGQGNQMEVAFLGPKQENPIKTAALTNNVTNDPFQEKTYESIPAWLL